MGYIYKITNDINQKSYIGKTEYSIEKRFKEHCSESEQERSWNRPLYRAMRKYGIEHFSISLIEETDNTAEAEQYWISYFNTYKTGYNATLGGDGTKFYDYDLIAKRLIEGLNATEISNEIGCCPDTVYHVAHARGISLKQQQQSGAEKSKKSVGAYSKEGQLIQQFNSISDATFWIQQSKKLTSAKRGIGSHICAVAKGKRKTAYGYVWKYLE